MTESVRRLDDSIETYKLQRASLEASNKIVTRPIDRIDSDILPSKQKRGGRKKKYSPTRMKNEINNYFEVCEAKDDLPSIKGLMIHLKMYKDMFYTYKEYPEYANIMAHAQMIIANWIETDIYNTKGLCAGKSLYAKNVIGWAEKTDTNNVTEIRKIQPEEARAKITMLAPKLLEMLKSNLLLNQLVDSPTIEAQVI